MDGRRHPFRIWLRSSNHAKMRGRAHVFKKQTKRVHRIANQLTAARLALLHAEIADGPPSAEATICSDAVPAEDTKSSVRPTGSQCAAE